MMDEKLPPPLVGCLICHIEGELSLVEGRKLPMMPPQQVLTCGNCGSVAVFDWSRETPERWRIKYRRVSHEKAYHYAALRFAKAGWLSADAALDMSTEVYIQRERVRQVEKGDLAWLKPTRLDPPPPLMSLSEQVYLSLKPVSYYEASGAEGLAALGRADVMLDTGTLYVTDSKIHLLGQRRDRSQRLVEINSVDYKRDSWRLDVSVGGQPHYYKGFAQEPFDAELIAAIIMALGRASRATER